MAAVWPRLPTRCLVTARRQDAMCVAGGEVIPARLGLLRFDLLVVICGGLT